MTGRIAPARRLAYGPAGRGLEEQPRRRPMKFDTIILEIKGYKGNDD